jgi:hypothetical protein
MYEKVVTLSNGSKFPTIKAFDFYCQKALKICIKHHEHVDKSKEQQLWFLVLDSLHEVQQNALEREEDLNSTFVVSHAKEWFSKVTRHSLECNVPFSDFIDHVLS